MTHRARKRFGQHFLQPVWSERVVSAMAPSADDVFLEIGPGRGAITTLLLARVHHVVAFEIDRDLVGALRTIESDRLTIVPGDFLDVTTDQITAILHDRGLGPARLRVAGNLPYNVASPILFKCLELYESGLPMTDAVVMLQREVADRLLAQPGTGDYGVLSVVLRHVASVARRLNLPPGAFRPQPTVHSALVALAFHRPTPPPRDLTMFRAITRAVFTRRRKTILNALAAWPDAPRSSAAALLATCGIDPSRRPETLDIGEFVRLADAVGGARQA